MFCSKCGLNFEDHNLKCLRCGQPAAASPPLTAQSLDRASSVRVIRILGRFWILFGALSFALGAAGLFMVMTGQSTTVGSWEPWPHPPAWNWTFVGQSAWIIVIVRVLLSLSAGWGLTRQTDWAKPVAVCASIFAMLQFPMGAVLGVYTLMVLLFQRGIQFHRQVVNR